ncbi:beta-galactosidase 9-like isoform X1 [Asparagus officinalis]|uniref:beta-galactosidase 9-like isoform X1 n=2 Tax=Asparagus officinalis TaxID=4686 RepID=UPI00098E21DC|nr:beta-galactosidase 9-like isoform X1 [Asparagus officinalis]
MATILGNCRNQFPTSFDAPEGNDTVALDLGSMGKGQAWVNGHGIGRFWSLVAPKTGCPRSCNYRGAYNEDKCTTNCGEPTQTRYHYLPTITYLIFGRFWSLIGFIIRALLNPQL